MKKPKRSKRPKNKFPNFILIIFIILLLVLLGVIIMTWGINPSFYANAIEEMPPLPPS